MQWPMLSEVNCKFQQNSFRYPRLLHAGNTELLILQKSALCGKNKKKNDQQYKVENRHYKYIPVA